MNEATPGWALLVRAGGWTCAVPLGCVAETMRPLPTERLAQAPAFVAGVAMVRGAALPVVDLGAVIGIPGQAAGRFVVVKLGARRAALAVEAVLGVRDLAGWAPGDLPPLLRTAARETIEAVGALDTELLLVFKAGRAVPEAVWHALAAGAS